jgi:hypothetical protein
MTGQGVSNVALTYIIFWSFELTAQNPYLCVGPSATAEGVATHHTHSRISTRPTFPIIGSMAYPAAIYSPIGRAYLLRRILRRIIHSLLGKSRCRTFAGRHLGCALFKASTRYLLASVLRRQWFDVRKL